MTHVAMQAVLRHGGLGSRLCTNNICLYVAAWQEKLAAEKLVVALDAVHMGERVGPTLADSLACA